MIDEVKPWPSSIARILANLVETRAGQRITLVQTEGGPPLSRPTGKSFAVLRGQATLSASELASLNSTRLGKFEIEWNGRRELVRLAPDAVSPGNPRELSNQTVIEVNSKPRTTYKVEFDLIRLTPPEGDQG
jgi:hypothetical protein